MFEKSKPRYLTKGVDNSIPLDIQIFLWKCIDKMPEPKDYLQVFRLSVKNDLQIVQHSSEQPKFSMSHSIVPLVKAVEAKVYIIDNEERCTMLLDEEY